MSHDYDLDSWADPADTGRPRLLRSGCLRVAGAAILILLVGGLLGITILQKQMSDLGAFIGNIFTTPTSITSGHSVVQKILSEFRLVSVKYNMEKVLTGSSKNEILQIPVGEDKILFIAYGEVEAGVDLSKIQDQDVQVNGDTVSLRIPRAEVLGAHLDNGKSRVYSRSTEGLKLADPNLETQLRKQAEDEMRAEAQESGILTIAQDNAANSMQGLLYKFGFKTVNIESPPAVAPTP